MWDDVKILMLNIWILYLTLRFYKQIKFLCIVLSFSYFNTNNHYYYNLFTVGIIKGSYKIKAKLSLLQVLQSSY